MLSYLHRGTIQHFDMNKYVTPTGKKHDSSFYMTNNDVRSHCACAIESKGHAIRKHGHFQDLKPLLDSPKHTATSPFSTANLKLRPSTVTPGGFS